MEEIDNKDDGEDAIRTRSKRGSYRRVCTGKIAVKAEEGR